MPTRFNETVNIRQVDSDVAGVSSSLSLANKLGDFKNKAIRFGEQEAVKRGVEGAKKTKLEKEVIGGQQVTKAPKMMADSFFGSIERNAHNKTLRSAYAASLDSDNRNAITSFATQYKDDIGAFNDAVEGYKAGVIEGVDPSIRQGAEIDLNGRIDGARIRVHQATIERQNKEAEELINKNAIEASNEAYRHARNGDVDLAEEELIKAALSIEELNLPDDVKAKRKREVLREYDENGKKHDLDIILETKGIEAAFEEVNRMEQEVPKGWTPDEWERFTGGVRTNLNKELSQQIKASKAALELQVKENEFASITARIAGDDSQIINPKSADLYYRERVLPELEGLPPEYKQARQALFMDKLKIVPVSIKAEISNSVRSGDPDLLKNAATLVDRMNDTRGLVDQIPTSDQAYLSNVVPLLDTMTPSEAIDLAMRATDMQDSARIEAVQIEINATKNKPELYRSKVDNVFGFFAPDIDDVSGAQMARDYAAVYESSRLAGMNDVDANNSASKMIKRNWGETEVFGVDRLMKYPPENYYLINGDSEWIARQAMSELKGEIAGVPFGKEDIVLMANDVTARTAAMGQPSYALKVLIDGSFQTIGQWRPDMAKALEKESASNIRKTEQRRLNVLNRQESLTRRGVR